MHRALYLEEILKNIFGHCYTDDTRLRWDTLARYNATASLAALARTCRAFKHPALDVLWTELIDLSPLSRCLPEVSCRIVMHGSSPCFSFSRPLVESEWDTLRSYTRRVWSIYLACPIHLGTALEEKALKMICNCPISKPLFPNLRSLQWDGREALIPLIHHLSASQLTVLRIGLSEPFARVSKLEGILCALGSLFPSMKKISIYSSYLTNIPSHIDKAISANLRCWTDLRTVQCFNITLCMDVLSHLSRMPRLSELSFTFGALSQTEPTPSDTVLVFSRLLDLDVKSEQLYLISWFISRILLPTAKHLSISFQDQPSKQILNSSLIAIQKACSADFTSSLSLLQTRFSTPSHPERYRLVIDDLHPCMALHNLRRVHINLQWTADLADHDLLELASAWPNLEQLLVNKEWGWRTTGGITPTGLLQLLRQCPLLRSFCLAIDTRNYADIAPVLNFEREDLSMDIVDSAILPEAVPAMAAFFGDTAPCWNFFFAIWSSPTLRDRTESEVPRKLWHDVWHLANARAKKRFHPEEC